jgi:hypothetical protein
MHLFVLGAFLVALIVVGCGSASKTTGPGDTVPPAAITDLSAGFVPGAGAKITLRWKQSPEVDLAGYRVYRSVDGGASTLVASGDVNGFEDTSLSGNSFVYQVSAFDVSNNESSKVSTAPIVVSARHRGGNGQFE